LTSPGCVRSPDGLSRLGNPAKFLIPACRRRARLLRESAPRHCTASARGECTGCHHLPRRRSALRQTTRSAYPTANPHSTYDQLKRSCRVPAVGRGGNRQANSTTIVDDVDKRSEPALQATLIGSQRPFEISLLSSSAASAWTRTLLGSTHQSSQTMQLWASSFIWSRSPICGSMSSLYQRWKG